MPIDILVIRRCINSSIAQGYMLASRHYPRLILVDFILSVNRKTDIIKILCFRFLSHYI